VISCKPFKASRRGIKGDGHAGRKGRKHLGQKKTVRPRRGKFAWLPVERDAGSGERNRQWLKEKGEEWGAMKFKVNQLKAIEE